MDERDGVAMLGNEDCFTVFEFAGKSIRFRCPYSLERYIGVKEWDKGYLVVDAKYSHSPAPVEEYIDLRPILSDLYMDAAKFLAPIREVRVAHA